MSEIEFTGERFMANLDWPDISYEHWHRYLFAAEFVKGKRVMDIACGEGYGSQLLAASAESVVGVDISPETVEYARQHYQQPNLEFRIGSVAQIPGEPDHSLDVIVSFETIEHVAAAKQTAFLNEVKRLLKPETGILIISTPNKAIYSDLPEYHNPYHLHEFTFREFKEFIGSYFKKAVYLGQKIYPVPYLWQLEQATEQTREFRLQLTTEGFRATQLPKSDMYDIAICSDQDHLPAFNSILLDLSEQIFRQREQQLARIAERLQHSEQERQGLEKKLQQVQTELDIARAQTSLPLQQNQDPGLALFAVSIIIPVYNKVEYTQKCLEAMGQHTPGDLFELILVDNASTDSTAGLLQSISGDVRVITNQENLGFVQACNQGATIARGNYLLFLNNDTLPTDGWLPEMLQLIASDPMIGAVGAKLVYPDGKLQEAGGIIFRDGSGWNYGRREDPFDSKFNQVCEVDYSSGACLLVKRDLFEKLGGFDLRFAPAYYEDTDLCFGIRRLGYKVMYCPAALVIHCEGATAGTDLNTGFKRFQAINQKKFVEKWRIELLLQEESPAYTKQTPVTADRARLPHMKKILQPMNADQEKLPLSILVIDPILPRYDRAAGSLRLFNILKILLQLGCRVTYIARNGVRQEMYKRELEAMGITVYATDPEKMAKQGHPIEAPRIDLPAILQERFYAIAWLSFFDIAEDYLATIREYSPQTQLLIDTVDIHFLRETRQAELYHDPQLMEKAQATKQRELAIYPQAHALITVTQAEKDVLLNYLPGQAIYIVPTIHAIKLLTPGYQERKGLLFVANFHHPPNADAVLYFVKEIFPEIKGSLPDIHFTIVGDSPSEQIRKLAGPDITVTGYVMATEPYVNAARISIAPLRFGAGMKGKVGEALSLGLPVVTTSIGAEGMGLTDGEQVLLGDNPRAFAQAVIRLYQDPVLWQKLAQQGREFLDANFSFRAASSLVAGILEQAPRPIGLAASGQTREGAVAQQLVSIIILTHNQCDCTQKCLASIFAHTQVPYELIIVDNYSTDNTRDYLGNVKNQKQLCCKKITVLENASNLGFAVGNNQGISQATGDFILLLNNDVVVTPHWLELLLACANQKPSIGMVGPMSNCVSGPQWLETPGYDTTSLQGLAEYAATFTRQRQGRAKPYWRVVGFCMLIKRKVIDKIGGLDGRFGLGNFEDDDFSLRASIAGFESWIAEDCFVHHFGNRTFKAAKIDYAKSLATNWAVFKHKWGLPAETAFGAPLDLTPTLQQDFKAEHYYALSAKGAE